MSDEPLVLGSDPNATIVYLTVHQAHSLVMGEIGAVPKDSTGQGVSYKFQGVADILEKAQPAMVRHGMALVPHKIKSVDQKDRTTKSGGAQVQVDVIIKWRLYGPAGDFLPGEVAGQAFDTSDKAMNKAQRASHKYALLFFFSIPEHAGDQDAERPELGAQVRTPPPMKVGQAKRYLADTLGKEKAEAVWKGMALDTAAPWSLPQLDQAVADFEALAEPFGEPEPPPGVDPQTGEMPSVEPEQQINTLQQTDLDSADPNPSLDLGTTP